MKPTKLILILLLFALFTSEIGYSQAISSYIMGQNAWMPSFRYNGKFEVLTPKLQAAGIQMIRIGGNTYNNAVGTNSGLTYAQYDILITSIKGAGAEPIVQLSNLLTYQAAKDLVTYLNLTKNYNIKYWSIGNEPDLKNLTSAQVKTYITTIAPAIRDVSANAIIFGPECAWMNGGIYGNMLDDLIGGSSSITGKDSNGRYYIDVVSYHSYDQYSITAIEDRIKALQTILTNANISRTDSPLTWAFTEFNTTTDNNKSGLSPDFKVWSMFAGQFTAEVYGLCMKYKALTLNGWSTQEGSGARTGSDLGLFDGDSPSTFKGRSNYYHTMMLGKFLKSNYMTTSSSVAGVKVVSTYDATGYQVLILNYNSTQYDVTVRLNNGAIVQSNPLLIKLLNGTTNQEHVSYVEAYGSRLLVFDINGNLTDDWRYTKTQSDLKSEPIYMKSSTPVLSTKSEIVSTSKLIVYPNPSKFNTPFFIDYTNTDINDLMIFDSTGKLLYTKKLTDDGTIKWNENDQLKPGMYVIKIGKQSTKLLVE